MARSGNGVVNSFLRHSFQSRAQTTSMVARNYKGMKGFENSKIWRHIECVLHGGMSCLFDARQSIYIASVQRSSELMMRKDKRTKLGYKRLEKCWMERRKRKRKIAYSELYGRVLKILETRKEKVTWYSNRLCWSWATMKCQNHMNSTKELCGLNLQLRN